MKNFIYTLLFFISILISNAQCPAGTSSSCDGSGTPLDLYWVGTTINNSGNWNSPCSWRVGSTAGVEPCQAPRSIDNVFFTNPSFSGNSGTGARININTIALCNNFYVDPLVNSLIGTPTFSLSNPAIVEIYGSLTLQNNLTWTTVGGPATGPEIYFKATSTGKTLKTNGKFLATIIFDGIGGEWRLQDHLTAGNMLFRFGSFNTSDGVNSYSLTLNNFSSKILTGASNTNRIINLNNSTVTMTGATANRYPDHSNGNPTWEAVNSTTVNTTFNCGTSRFNFPATSIFTRFGGWTYNVIKHNGLGQFYDHTSSDNCYIDTLETNGYLYFHHKHIFNVLKINSVGQIHDFWYDQIINTDLIVSGNNCTPTVFNSTNNQLLTLPTTVSADPMIGYEIKNLKVTPAHTFTGSASGTTTGWTAIAPAIRNLYWVGNTNTNWNEPTNWSNSPTGTPLLTGSDCPPTQTDDVFFNTVANGKTCNINAESYCRNMTWTITMPTTFSGASDINIYGNVTLDVDINFTNTSYWYMRGSNIGGHTLLSAGKTFNNMQFSNFSRYTLLDDLNFNYKHLYYITSFNSSGYSVSGQRITFEGGGTTTYTNSTVTLSNSNPWYIAGSQGTMVYNSSSHVIFTNTTANTLIGGWAGPPNFPNLTLSSPNTTLRFSEYFGAGYGGGYSPVFNGNVSLNGNARFYGDNGTGVAHGALKNITITGNLNLTAGKLYEFGVLPTFSLHIGGNINSIGTCSDPITIKGINSDVFRARIVGSKNFDYTTISDCDAISPFTVTNCLDGGNNTNITFNPPGASTTYYWRAAAIGGLFNGNWSTGSNWTTISTSTVGAVGCMPGPYDHVVFDNLSFNSAQTTVSVTSNVSFNNITSTASNVRILGPLGTNMTCIGNVTSDGTLQMSTYLGNFTFASSTTGKTINFGSQNLAGDVFFTNSNGGYALQNKLFTTTDIYVNAGRLNTNGYLFEMRRFRSSGTSPRELNLSNSIMNINGTGTPGTSFLNDGTDVLTWDTKVATNFTFTAGTSTVNITSGSTPIIKGNNLTFYKFNCTNTSSNINTSPIFLIDSWNTRYMKLSGSARIYGNNAYDTLHFTPNNIYRLENNKIQTLKAPNGILIATGSPGQEIAIKAISTGGTPAQFRKLNTAGTMLSFCFDYISVEDNIATSDDALFKFFVGLNGNNISATGIWDFSRALFVTPSIRASADLNQCPGTLANMTFSITGSGPYILDYKVNGGATTSTVLPNGTTLFTIPNVSHYSNTTYSIVAFKGDNCSVLTPGTLLDTSQVYNVTPSAAISANGDLATCTLANENQFVHFYKDAAPRRPICSISDASGGTGLGTVTASVQIDATVQVLNGIPYLQRRFGITPTSPQLSTIRLYFTQAEITALSTKNIALGFGAVALADLMVTKFDNNAMNFTGAASLMTVTARGAIPAGITTTGSVYFLEFQVSSYSHFVIHPPTIAPLPVELVYFKAQCLTNNEKLISWQIASETNNAFFTIEKSTNGIEWEELAQLAGAANSTSLKTYNYTDDNFASSTIYYRLKQTDIDGSYKYSTMIDLSCDDVFEIAIYPNPSYGVFNVNAKITNKDVLDVELYNSIGQLVYRNQINETHKEIQMSDIAHGLYYIVLKRNDVVIFNKKLISAK